MSAKTGRLKGNEYLFTLILIIILILITIALNSDIIDGNNIQNTLSSLEDQRRSFADQTQIRSAKKKVSIITRKNLIIIIIIIRSLQHLSN